MRTLVILLSSFLFHWEAVSRGIPSETPRQGGEGERLGIAGEERILDEVGGGGTSLVDGRQKSRPTRDGLTRREIGSVEEAWSGTDWGGSHLPRFAEDRQELDRKERNLSPLISLLESNLKETELKKHRDRRSLISDTHGDEEIRKILMNAREKLSDLKSRNTIDDDWIFFVLPSRSGTLTESLFRPAGNGFKIGAQSWRQNEKWLDDKEFLNANKFDYNERNLKKYEESPLSDWNIDGRNKYSGEPAEISWTGEGRSDEKNGGTNFALTKGGRNRSNKQRLIKNDAHRNGDEDYRGIKVNVDVKNGETYGDISIDNTMGNVVGSDKLSAAEISVKIPGARYNKAIRNKRPSSDNKSRFVSDPFVFLTEFEGGTRREEKNKGSTPRESNVIKVHQSPPGGKLIEKKVEEKPYRDSKYSFPIIVGKHLDAKFSNDESRSNKNGGERARMDDELSWIEKEEAKLKQGEKNSGELQVLQLLKELSNIREQIERNQNLYGGNERNHGSSPSRVERIDARNGIRVEYDKQKSAAETSIPLDVNKRGGVKHGERVEEKSTSKIDENVDGERKKEKKGMHRDELQKETVKKRDDYDSDENVKWTSLKGKQKVIDDVNKDKDKLEKKTFEKGNSEVRKSQQIGINNKTNLSKIKFNVENLEEKDNHERKKQDSKIENENFQEKLKEKFDTENLKKIIFGVKIPKIKGIEDSNINSEDFRLENLNWIEYKGENLDTEDNEGNLRKENEIKKNIDNNINGQKYGSNNLKEGKRKKFKIQEQRGQNILVDTKKEYKSDDIKDEKISAKEEDREKYDNTKVKETGIGIKTPQDEKLNTETLKNKGLEINIPKIEVNDVKKDDNTLLLDKSKWADINADNLETTKIEDTVEKNKWNGIDKLKNNIEVDNAKKYELDDIKNEKISPKEEDKEKYDNTKVKETSIEIKTPQDQKQKTETLKDKGLEINIPKIEVEDVKKDDNKLLIDKPQWTDINADNLKTAKIEDTIVKDNWKGIDDLKNVEIDNGKKYKLNDIKKEKLNAKEEDKEKYDNTKVKDIGIENKIPQDEKFKTETLKNKGLEINIPKTEVKDVKKDDNKLLIDKPQWTDINADNLETTKIEDTVEKDKWKGIDELKKNVEVDNGKKYELDNTKAEKISAKEEEKYDNSKVKETSTAIKTPQDEELKTETLKNKGLEINTPKIEVKDNNKFLLEKPKWADISLDNLKTTKIEDSIEKDQWKEIDELKKNTVVDNGKKFELDNTKNKKISAKEDEKYDNSKVKETSTEIKNPQDEKLNIENLKNKGLEINIPKIEVEDVKKDDNKLLIDKPQWTDINADNLKTAKIEDTVEKDKWKGIDELKKNVEVDNAKELGVTEDEKINKEEEKKYDNSKVKETSIEIKTPQDEKLKTETLKNKGLEINTPKIEVNDVKKDDNTLLLDKPKWADINADNLKTAKIEDTVEKDKWKGIDELKKNVEVDNAKESGVTEDEKINKEEEEKYDNSKVKETSIEIKTPQDEKLKTETLKNKGLEINTPKIEVNDVKEDDNKLLINKPQWTDINADNLQTTKIEDTIKKDKWKGIDELKKNVEVDNGKKYELDDTKEEKINAKVEEKYDNLRVKETGTAIKTPQDEELKTETLENKGLEIDIPKIEVKDVKKDDSKLLVDKPKWTNINAGNLKTAKIEDIEKDIEKDKWKGIDELKKNVEIDNGKKYELDDTKEERINAKEEEKYDNSRVKDTSTAIKTAQDELKTKTLENKGLEINIPKTEVKDVKKDDSKLLVDKPQWTDINADNLKTVKIEDTIEKDKWKGIDELEKNTVDRNEKKYELNDKKNEKISPNEEDKQKYDNTKVKETSIEIKTPQDEELKTETLENKGLEINIPKTKVKDIQKDDSKLLVDKPQWTNINADNLKTTKIEDTVEKDKWKGIKDLEKNVEVDNGKKYELDDTKDKKISAKEDEKYDNSIVKETSTGIKTPQDEKLNIENLKDKGFEINIPKTEVEDVKKDDNKLLIDKPQWTDINADNLKTAKIEDTIEKDKWKGIKDLEKNVEVDNGKKYELDDTKDKKISAKEDEKYDDSRVKETNTAIKTPQDEELKTETLENKGLEINIPKTEVKDVKKDDSKGLEINIPKTEVEDVKKDDNKLLVDKSKWTNINADNLKTAKIEDTVEKDKWKGIDELDKDTVAKNGKKYELDDIKNEIISPKEEDKEKYNNTKVKETSIEIKTPQDEKLKTETLKDKGLEINIPKIEVEDVKKDDNKLLIDKSQWTDINADNLKTTMIEDTLEKDKWKRNDELKKNVEVDNGKENELNDIKNEKGEDKEKFDNSKVKETSIAIKTPQDQKFGTENLKNEKLDIVHSRIDKFGDINVENIKFQKGKWTDYNVDNLNRKESNSLEKYEWKELINRIDELIRDIEVYNAKKYNLNNINDKKIGARNRSKEKYDISNIKDTSIETKIPKEQKIPIKRLEEDKYKIINPEIIKLGDIKIDDNKFQVGKWTDYNVDNLKLKENNSKEILEENKWKRFNDLRKKNTEIDNKKKNKSNDIRDEKISITNKDIERYDNSKVKETDVEAKTPHEKKLDIREEYVKENKLKADDVFRPKLKNVVEKESKMKDNNGKEYISNTDNEKLEDENTSEKEFQLQKLNKGNKLKSKDLKEEKNDRKISVEEDLETKKSKIEDTKKDKFSLQNKIGKVIQENDKFKAEDLKVKEIGLKNSREEYILKDKESGSVNLKNGKNQLLVIEKFKPHFDNNVLWTSKKNDKNSVQSVVNDSKKKDIISYNDKISLKERNESSEKDKKIDDEYEKGTKKYGINENFDSIVNIRNDKNLKKDFWNKDIAYKKEDLYVTRDNALENSNKRNKSEKQDYEVISYKKPLNENEEHEIFENKSRNNNEKLISNEEEVIYKDGNADKISQYENKLKEDLKIEENDENRIKQTGPSFVKEEINETGNIRKKGNEKFDKEILKSSEVENDSLKNDDKKDLKLERTFDKNTLTTEENNVLIRGEELQTVPILSEKTKIAKKEETFGNAETNKKDSVLLSEKTKLEDKKSLNEFEIHEDKNKELENNDVDVARATEFNKLSKYKNNDTIKTANIESNRVSNDIVVNSRQTDSADKINKKLGKNGKESSTIQFENLNRTMDSLDITIAGEGNLRNSKGNEELSTAAHVAKLDENKALRSSEDDTSEVETSTGIKSNSDTSAIVNRTADKGQIEIRGSSVNLSELSDIDVHPPEHSDTLGKKDNPSLVSRTVSVDDNEIGGNKIPRYEGSSNVDTRKGSEESKKETESTKKESENVLLLNDSKKNEEESKKEKKIGIQSVKESSLKAQETASNLSKESDFDNKFDAKPTDSIDIQTDTKDVKKADDKLYTSREEEANSENTREKYHTKPRILESSELNSNILPKILRRNEPDLVEKLKTTSNDDVNLKQTTVSSSTRGSKFPDNNGASRERNISSNAINQAAEEELEKKKITWRNAAVDHPSEENDSKMINLSFTNIDKNEMREAKKGGTSSVITDEKSRTDDTRTTFSNVVDLIEKNSKKLENYNNDRSINKVDKYGTNDSRDRFEESKIDSSSLRDLKQERVTRKDKLNDSKNVEKIEEEGVRNESESITGDLNKKEVFKEGSDGGIQVTESNDVTGESEDSSSAPKDEVSLSDLSVKSFGKNDKLEKKQRGTLDLSIKDEGKSEDGDEIIGSSGMRGSNKYKTPSTTRQLIEDNELEQFLPTSIQTALNTKTTSQVYPSDVDENPITSRLPEDVTAHAFNWADNERYKELPNKVVAPIPEKIRDNTQIYDSSASRSPKLETGNKLSKLGKQTDEKIENAKENDEKGEKIDASNVTKLKNVEEEKVKSKNILNEYNDKNNKNVNEIGSLKESKISDIENNKREEKKSLNENDKLKVQEKNENIEINNKDLTNNYDENLKSKILTDVNVAEDRDNLLKNDKLIGHKDIPEKEEKNSVLKLLLNEEKIKGSEDKVKKLLIDDNNNDKRDESIGTRIKIIPEKLNKKQNKETKLNGESKNYEDKLLSAKYRIAKPNENLDEILDDERETQIQKTLTESEIAITELPLLKQNKEENIIEEKEKTNFKVEEERTSNENQPYKTIYNTDNETIENQKGYNIVSNQLNSTASDLNLKNKNEILKEHEIQDKFNSNIARNILIKPYHISTVDKNDFTNSALSDSNKKIYESKIEDQLINDQMNLKKTADSDSSIKSTHISDAIKNGLVLDDSKNTIHESNIKNALNFNVKDDAHNVLIKSTDVAKNKLHDEYKNSILSDSKKIIHGSKAENESKFNIKDNNIFKLDSTSTAINNNLNIKNENSVLNHPKQVNYESNVKDQSKFDLKKDIKSDTSVKSATINDLNTGYNDSKDSKILILKSKIPKLESKLDLKKNIGSDTSVKSIPKPLDQRWANILFDQPPSTNKIAINNPSKIPSIPSLGNAHFSLDEKERNLKSSGLLSHISQKTPSNEISVEIPNVKFVKKLQPSFWKLAKPQTEIVNKNEQPILVSLSEFKSHPDEKDSDRSMKFSSYTPPSKVSGVESKNDDLYTVLKSLSLFTHFQDDSKDKKVPTTYDDRVSTSEDAPKVGSVEKMNDKSSSISQESDREKLDVYIVKQASEGPVKIAHIENTKPLVVTNEEISRSSYEKVVDILEKNGIKTDISTA